MLGEYGTASGVAASEVMDQLCSIVETQNVSDTVRGYMLTAFGKLASHFGQKLTPAAEEIQHSASLSANPDLQQRALELQALLRLESKLLRHDYFKMQSRPFTIMQMLYLKPLKPIILYLYAQILHSELGLRDDWDALYYYIGLEEFCHIQRPLVTSCGILSGFTL